MGMAIAPEDFDGPVIQGNEGLVVTYNGRDILRWSSTSPESYSFVVENSAKLLRPMDVAIGIEEIIIVDYVGESPGSLGKAFRLEDGNVLQEIVLGTPIEEPVGVAFDAAATSFLIADRNVGGQPGRILRLNPGNGQVSAVFSGFNMGQTSQSDDNTAACIDATPDGKRVIVTASVGKKIYEFTRSN
jgi:hypothetical protein